MTANATSVVLEKVVKRYGDVEVIHGIDLNIDPGEFTVFVGPSGCGKSTLLRMVAGLEPITGGDLLIDGQVRERVQDFVERVVRDHDQHEEPRCARAGGGPDEECQRHGGRNQQRQRPRRQFQ